MGSFFAQKDELGTMTGSRRTHWLALLVLALGGIAILAPGFDGPFILDDFSNITENTALQVDDWDLDAILQASLTNTSGPLGRPVSMFSFALNVMASGMDAWPMKFTNAVLHGIAGVLFTLLALRLFAAAPMGLAPRQRRHAAFLAGACWMLHPLAITSTLYVVQRMNLLAALFTFAVLLAYLKGRSSVFQAVPRAIAWFALAVVLWVLGVLSKESALLAPLYVLLLEWLVLEFRDQHGTLQPAWRRLVLGTAGIGAALVITAIVLGWDRWTGGYEFREFTLAQRLLTEARVLWEYIGMTLLPGHARLGLFLDDITLSRGLLTPWTTLLSIIGLLGLAAAAVAVRKRMQLVSFGALFFLVGHLMESTFIPLEIAFEHRNYLPAAGLLLALAAAIMLLAKRMNVRLLEWLPLGAFALFLAFFTVLRSVHWSDMYMLAQLEAHHHPDSSRAQTQLGFVYTQFARRAAPESGWPGFYMDAAAEHFQKAADANSNSRVPLFLWYLHARAHGRTFPDTAFTELLDRLHTGLPTADTASSLNMLFECVLEGCGVPAEELETMLRVALENPRLHGRGRSETLVVAAKHFRFIRQDIASAVTLLHQAVDASPDEPRFRLFLAQQLLAAGDVPAARRAAGEATRLDEWGVYREEINALLRQMD